MSMYSANLGAKEVLLLRQIRTQHRTGQLLLYQHVNGNMCNDLTGMVFVPLALRIAQAAAFLSLSL